MTRDGWRAKWVARREPTANTVALAQYQLTCSSTSSVSTMHAPRTDHVPHMLTLPSYIRRTTGRRPRTDPEHSPTQAKGRRGPASVCCGRIGACAAGRPSTAAHVESGAASVLSYHAPAGHEHPADAKLSTPSCGIAAAATTSGTSSRWAARS